MTIEIENTTIPVHNIDYIQEYQHDKGIVVVVTLKSGKSFSGLFSKKRRDTLIANLELKLTKIR